MRDPELVYPAGTMSAVVEYPVAMKVSISRTPIKNSCGGLH